MNRTVLAAALFAGSLGFASFPSDAQPRRITIEIAPPAPRVEVVPNARRGYIWQPGYWNWNGRRHNWTPGVWVRERPGYIYSQPQWVQRDNRWELRPGKWARGDRDRDGRPNRVDRDRDGDGVRNRDDRRPDNPRRQ